MGFYQLICCAGCACSSGEVSAESIGQEGPPCCICEYDVGLKSCDSPTPHNLKVRLGGLPEPPCGCECDPGQAGQVGSYTAQYDSNGVMTDNVWDGECPSDIPDFDSDTCSCVCKKHTDGSCLAPFYVTGECECECSISSCSSPTPVLNSTTCECEPCNLTADDCPDSTPSIDTDKCECYCEYDDPNGGNTCPSNTPELNGSTCTCECNLTSSDCVDGQEFDSDTCSCIPCSTTCDAPFDYPTGGGCDCVCTHSGICNDPALPTFNSTSCQCTCEEPSCIDGEEVFDQATCSCVPIYTQTLLNSQLLP